MRKTKIVCTIGPASRSRDMLGQLIDAGMDVARLNFSHGSHAEHAEVLEALRSVSKERGRPVAVLQDLCGPKIRVTRLEGGSVELVPGRQITIEPGREVGDAKVVGTSLETLADDVKPGHRILLDDGLMELRVEKSEAGRVVCDIINGGTLKERKGMNLPDSSLRVPALTKKDEADLAWGLANGVDYVALSFVRSVEDLKIARRHIESAGKTGQVHLVAKIERPEAVQHMVEVVEETDVIMVARGDLGVELPVHEVPSIQKKLIRECILRDRSVITATQMLDSMTKNPRPTRAEVSDVANAIYDGTDAVMLSGETAAGNYPTETVATMSRVAVEAEAQLAIDPRAHFESRIDQTSFADSLCHGAWRISKDVDAKLIVTFTNSGRTALFMSNYFPTIPVVGVSFDAALCRRMNLYRGVVPMQISHCQSLEELLVSTESSLVQRGLAAPGDVIVYVGGTHLVGIDGYANAIKVHRLGEPTA